MNHKVIIIDFGSQYTQLIARRVREQHIYCEIIPFYDAITWEENIKGVILSGSPCSVNEEGAPDIDLEEIIGRVPVLAVCYGAQLIAKKYQGKVATSEKREYGRAVLQQNQSKLFASISPESQVWMSHGDHILNLPQGYQLIGSTASVEVAAFEHKELPVYALQFHPEVTHSLEGGQIIRNFLYDICHIPPDWTPLSFIEETVANIQNQVGDQKVICGLSGGVDSTVAATLIHRAIGDQLTCIFVDNGILRKQEFEQVMKQYETLGLNVIGVDAKKRFLDELAGITEPEAKRKTIGRVFIDVFQEEAERIQGVDFLAQGTIYPDVIESVSVKGPSATI
ncbi:MAG: glutamine-hydrolyzing GMP synthase, partial [Bacteroidota bacterium]